MTVSTVANCEPAGVPLASDLAALERAIKANLVCGAKWYLVESHWFEAYQEFLKSGDVDKNPGPIDNGPLMDENGDLKANLTELFDFVFVPSNVWEALVSTVGLKAGQNPMERCVIEHGLYNKTLVIETRPPVINVALASAPEKAQKLKISRGSKLEDLRDRILTTFNLDRQESRLYQQLPDAPADRPYELLRNLATTLYDLSLTEGRLFLLDVKNPEWTLKLPQSNDPPPPPPSMLETPAGGSGMSTRSASLQQYSSNTTSSSSSNASAGLCGLSNLGNTCFMNSGLQCMSNCPPLTEYFQQGRYESEINVANPLGTGGEMARAYANLIKEMWSGRNSSVIPRHMKQTIGRFKETFLGYQQQDSQELIAFLLDGLHEDLNRVRKKPYIEAKEDDSRPEDVIANESWANYKLRNDSVIVDLFHGQIKSTVVCPECDKVSVTFDPSCYLSVPLPQRKDRMLPLTLLYRNPSRPPTQFKVMVPKSGTVGDLAESLSKLSGLPANRLVIYDLYNYKIFKVFEADQSLSSITDRDDVYVCEVEHPIDSKDFHLVQVFHRVEDKLSLNGFGVPIVLSLPKREFTYEELSGWVTSAIQRWLDQPGENWWKGDNDSTSDSGMDDNGEENEVSPPPLFRLCQTNSFNSTTVKDLKPGDVYPADFDLSYIGVDWHQRAQKFYRTIEPVADVSVSAAKDKQKGCGLLDCFDLYTTTEQLGQDDAWFCPQCKKHQRASKTLQLWRLPKVLIVQLKRFQYTRYYRDKIETLVDFPLTGLDVTQFIASVDKGQHVYDLFAISNHMGGLGGGHYTAYAKNVHDGRWYEFDDSRVTLVKEERAIVTKYGYVLFYLRREEESTDVEMKEN